MYQRKLLSFSMKYDWAFIKITNSLHKYYNYKQNDDEDFVKSTMLSNIGKILK